MVIQATLFFLTLGTALGDWSQGIYDVDFRNNDISSFQMTDNSSLTCYKACEKEQGCVGWVYCPSGPGCCGTQATCWLKSALINGTEAVCRVAGFSSRALYPQAITTTPIGSVTPTGWLKDELNVVASGLMGYLPHFWPDIANSSFIGGKADGGLHERAPYWLNGLVPASFLTNDENLVALRTSYISYIIANQDPSGWVGIDDMPKDGNQYWSRFNIILALEQYYEGTQDPKAITCIFNLLGEINRRLSDTHLDGWATVRAQDLIMGVFWLVDNFDTLVGIPPGFSQAWLVLFADLVHSQMLQYDGDWKSYFDTPAFPESAACVTGMPCNMLTHGVNIGQAIKSEAVWYRRSQDETDADSTFIRMRKLDQYHGVPSGMYQADEHLAGALPSHGTETCAVVEAVVSYAQSGAILGDASLFERAERITYNALPASMTKDTWERVYLQGSNEYNATSAKPFIWITDGADSPVFGLEGNYGCCTANMHAGWPKFTARAVGWTNTSITLNMWAPLKAITPLGSIEVVTDYPFGDTATVTVTPNPSTSPANLLLRIPSWASQATLSIDGGAATPLLGSNGTFYPTRTRAGGLSSTFVINFNPQIRLESWGGGQAVVRGALVYGAWIGQIITVTGTHPFNSKDLDITSTTPWNVALQIADLSNPAGSLTFTQTSTPTAVPFNSTAIPVMITGKAKVVNGWVSDKNAPSALPASPACATSGSCSDIIDVVLVPFGSTHVRMAVLPIA